MFLVYLTSFTRQKHSYVHFTSCPSQDCACLYVYYKLFRQKTYCFYTFYKPYRPKACLWCVILQAALAKTLLILCTLQSIPIQSHLPLFYKLFLLNFVYSFYKLILLNLAYVSYKLQPTKPSLFCVFTSQSRSSCLSMCLIS